MQKNLKFSLSIASVVSASVKELWCLNVQPHSHLHYVSVWLEDLRKYFHFFRNESRALKVLFSFLAPGTKNAFRIFLITLICFHQNRNLFETLLSLQPQVSSGTQGERPEDKVLDLAADVLKKVPDTIDYDQTAKILAEDPSPLNVVLLQEVMFEPFVSVSFKSFFLPQKQMFLEVSPESFASGGIVKI